MAISTVSTAYLNSALLPSVRQAQSQLATLETESTTGQYADLGLQLGGQNGYELSLRTQDDLLQTLTTNNNFSDNKLTTTQTTLDSIRTAAQATVTNLVPLTSASTASSVMQTYGQTNLAQLISSTNTTAGTDYIFGGENTGTPPLNDYYATPTSPAKTAIDNAFQTFFGFGVSSPQVATITSSQMQSFLSGPFAAQFQGSNWTSNWSNASSVNTTATVAPGQTVQTSTNANITGIQNLAQGYAMLSEFGGIGLGVAAQQTLASTAVSVINHASSSILDTQSQLGLAQNQITQANDYISSQSTMLQTTLGKIDDVNAAQIATELTTLTTQLQSSYQLTAQISKLNLAQYLPTA